MCNLRVFSGDLTSSEASHVPVPRRRVGGCNLDHGKLLLPASRHLSETPDIFLQVLTSRGEFTWGSLATLMNPFRLKMRKDCGARTADLTSHRTVWPYVPVSESGGKIALDWGNVAFGHNRPCVGGKCSYKFWCCFNFIAQIHSTFVPLMASYGAFKKKKLPLLKAQRVCFRHLHLRTLPLGKKEVLNNVKQSISQFFESGYAVKKRSNCIIKKQY